MLLLGQSHKTDVHKAIACSDRRAEAGNRADAKPARDLISVHLGQIIYAQ